MPSSTIAFLGPEGTFAHLAAQKRFGKKKEMVGLPTVKEVFDYVSSGQDRLGIVPIENSSGGTIYETVDRLVDPSYGLFIQESLSINVRLALLGRKRDAIEVIYSHFAPLHHCEQWIARHFPEAERRETTSTAKAVQAAAENPRAAAIGNRQAGKIYKLKILEFPIEQDVANVTQFYVLGHKKHPAEIGDRTSLVVILPNAPGALLNFLTPFKDEGVNLTRIISRPIIGKPNTYIFLIDLRGRAGDQNVRNALKKAAKASERIINIGSYPTIKIYQS